MKTREAITIASALGFVALATMAQMSVPGVLQIIAGNGLTGGTIGPGTIGTIGLTAPVSVGNGGTGLTSAGSNNNCLVSNGSAWTSASCPGGSPTFPLTAPNGNTSAPSYSFASNTGSGIYTNGSGTILMQSGEVPGNAGGTLSLLGANSLAGDTYGGAVTVQGGSSINSSFRGGNVTVQGGTTTAGPSGGGSVTIQGGTATGTGEGGAVAINGGSGSATGGVIVTSPTIQLNAGAGAAAGSSMGGSGSYHHLAGLTNAAVTSTGNGADMTEDTLQTYSLPGVSFEQAGRCVRVTSWGTLAANGDTKTIRLYIGASVLSSGALTANGVNWIAHMISCNSAINQQTVIGDMTVGTTVVAPVYNAASEQQVNPMTIKTTGQAGTATANDIVSKGQLVEFLN